MISLFKAGPCFFQFFLGSEPGVSQVCYRRLFNICVLCSHFGSFQSVGEEALHTLPWKVDHSVVPSRNLNIFLSIERLDGWCPTRIRQWFMNRWA